MVVRGRETRVQTTARPGRTLPEHWKTLSRGQQKKDIECAEDIKQARETRERAALRAWTRQDKQAKHFRTTAAGGPTWNTVERRITYDMGSGAVIRDEDVKGVTNKEILHAKLPGGPRDISTLLYYRQPSPQPAGVARALVLIDGEGSDFGAVNPLAREFTPSVAVPTMPRGPTSTPARRDNIPDSPWARRALVARKLNKREVAAEP
eukprot:4898781-Pyramimonas_sp.AAC.1